MISQDNNATPGPSRDKGKGPDPRNWGQIALDDYEQDLDLQKDTYEELLRIHHARQEQEIRRNTGYRIPSATPSIRASTREESQPINFISRNSILGQMREREERDLRLHQEVPARQGIKRAADPYNRRHQTPERHNSIPIDNPPNHRYGRAPPDPAGDPDDDGDDDGFHDRDNQGRRRHWSPPRRPRRAMNDRNDEYYEDDYYPRKPIIPPQSPKSYNGEENLDKYIRFRSEASGYCRRGRVHPRDQIEVISPFLEGKAYNFYLSHASANPESWTLPEFLDALFNHCFPPTFKSSLRNDLKWENQGKKKVLEFVRDLTVKLDTVGIDDEATRVNYLWFGLEPRIQSALWRRDLNPEFSSWHEVVRSAIASENADRAARSSQPNHINPNNNHNTQNRSHQNTSLNNGNRGRDHSEPKMNQNVGNKFNGGLAESQPTAVLTRPTNTQNNAGHNRGTDKRPNQNGPTPGPSGARPSGTANTTKPRLTDEQIQQYMAQGKCFKCDTHGHLARNCPKANVVQSSRPGKPPGMAVHNMEMGYTTNLEDSPVLETLPMMSLGMISFEDGGDPEWERYLEEVGYQTPSEIDEPILAPFEITEYEQHSFSDTKEYTHEPDWMSDYSPVEPNRSHARCQIGDALAMQATYVLNVSQPYPGDSHSICVSQGVENRFEVRRVNNLFYGIFDIVTGSSTWVEKRRLEHPNFRLGRFYARYRNWQTKRPDVLKAPYPIKMGDAYSVVASYLLRDGIWSHYPNLLTETDPEDRFHVELWAKGHDAYVIMDNDRNTATIIDGEHLRNPHFDLVRWYQLAVREERGLVKDTYPLYLFERGSGYTLKPESEAGSDITCNYNDDEPIVNIAETFDDDADSLPGLQSVSYTGSDVGDLSDYDPMEDLRAEYERYEGKDVKIESAFGQVIVDILDGCAPYPADDRYIYGGLERFEVFCDPKDPPDVFRIRDRKRNELLTVQTDFLRDSNYDLGQMYAVVCCARSRVNDFAEAMAEWRERCPEGSTNLERYFETMLAPGTAFVEELIRYLNYLKLPEAIDA
ncbi:hypothetical protein CVT24_012651 [Panaeolus cyanescens]|uniref:CCHC-type domain-containing protein n=1 Tax=Panaeolus cyanescens TaxID=181874 RepID=A0A409WKP8_9AGAR|nr:hypothetical protein CVT24_012651 [Panaeolus cyanescens]